MIDNTFGDINSHLPGYCNQLEGKCYTVYTPLFLLSGISETMSETEHLHI